MWRSYAGKGIGLLQQISIALLMQIDWGWRARPLIVLGWCRTLLTICIRGIMMRVRNTCLVSGHLWGVEIGFVMWTHMELGIPLKGYGPNRGAYYLRLQSRLEYSCCFLWSQYVLMILRGLGLSALESMSPLVVEMLFWLKNWACLIGPTKSILDIDHSFI
jgi:hypothetical protein